MPGYKLYQNDTLMGVVPLPRRGSSNPAYIRKAVKRDGHGHPLPAPPYVRRNVYSAEHSRVLRYGIYYSGGKQYSVVINANTGNFPRIPRLPQSHLNAVYEKFRSEVFGEQASLGITLAQWRQSWGMVANRSYQLAKAARQLYRGRFREFLQTLGISKPKKKHLRKKRSRPREAAGLWLEYSFGWKPLAGDIFSAFEQLQEPIPVDTYAASKQTFIVRPGGDSWVSRVLTTQRADVVMTNPNLFLTAQLGLINIGDVLFDAVPFSFVLDWFTDCQLWIQSHTDWVGLRVEYPAISNKAVTYFTYHGGANRAFIPCTVHREAFTRELGMIKPLPNLDILANIGKSKTRGANAMSLLTQILSKF